MAEKKYYWLKLKEDFFDDKYIKALRKLPDGNALVVVYLKMQLKSLKTEGFIKYDHLLPSQDEELALILDEDVNIVRLTLTALINMKLVENWDNETLYMAAMQNLIGKETAVAERVRKHREKQKLLQCNSEVTKCNTEKEKKEKRKELDINIKEDASYDAIISYLNLKANTSYKSTTKKTQSLINARISEGFTLDDFKKVIDNKTREWLNTEWEKYLRPETLFGNKFEGYLNTKTNQPNQPKVQTNQEEYSIFVEQSEEAKIKKEEATNDAKKLYEKLGF